MSNYVTTIENNNFTIDLTKTGGQGASGLSLVWRGAWSAGQVFAQNDFITINNAGYICTIAHTSGTFSTDLAAVKWEVVVTGVDASALSVVSSGDGSLTFSGSEFTYTGPSATEQQAHFSATTTGTGYGDLTYSAGVFTYDKVTSTEVRGEISSTDSGGDGSLSYDNSTGVITYQGPVQADVLAHLSGGTGVSLSAGGEIALDFADAGFKTTNVVEGTNLYYTDARAQGAFTASTGVGIASGAISIGQAVETTSDVTFNKVTTDLIEGGSVITIDPAGLGNNTGSVVISGDLTVNGTTTTVNSTEVNIGDSVIVLNSNEAGTPTQNGGIEIERGTSTNKSFIWNETDGKWDLVGEELQNVILDGGTY
jgi:hypothetical protein